MRALSLIRGRKENGQDGTHNRVVPPSAFLKPEARVKEDVLTWQARPLWLRKPHARQNLWN